jgi:hypothetical protein
MFAVIISCFAKRELVAPEYTLSLLNATCDVKRGQMSAFLWPKELLDDFWSSDRPARYQTIGKLRRVLERSAVEGAAPGYNILRFTHRGRDLDDSVLISDMKRSDISSTMKPHRVVYLNIAQHGFKVCFDSSATILGAVAPYLREHFHFPIGATRIRFKGDRVPSGPLSGIKTTREDAISFRPTGYVVIPVTHQGTTTYFTVPRSGTFLDLISVMQVRRATLNLPLGHFELRDGNRLLGPKQDIGEWTKRQERFQLRSLACECIEEWDVHDQVQVHVTIAGRQDYIMFPAMATLAYVRSWIGARYHVLWDNVWLESGLDLSWRVGEIQNRVVQVSCWNHKVTFSFPRKDDIIKEQPILSQVCDLRQEYARKAKIAPFNFTLGNDTRALADEERFNDIGTKTNFKIFVRALEPPVNRLYFRVRGMKVIKDVPPNKTFRQLAVEFGGITVAFELDGQLLSRCTKVDAFMGHPKHPIYVVTRSLFLPITATAGDFYVEVNEKMTVRELRTKLPDFAEACRFCYEKTVLEADHVIMNVNPDLLPVKVRSARDIR